MTAFSLSVTDHIAVLTLDTPGEPVNVLGTSVIGEMEELLARIRDDGDVRAVVLISGKADNFVAGADLNEFIKIKSADEGTALARAGQEVINRLEQFPKPIVTAIHGSCVGLGCELALATSYRIVRDGGRTPMGK